MWGEGVEDRIAPKGAIRNSAGRSFKVVASITHNLVTRDTNLKKCQSESGLGTDGESRSNVPREAIVSNISLICGKDPTIEPGALSPLMVCYLPML